VADRDGRPPQPVDRPVGEIVGDISQKISLLVREEVELAKAEVGEKVQKLIRGAAVGAAAGVFAVLALIYFLHALANFIQDALDGSIGFAYPWAGYLIVTGILLLLAAVAGLLAVRFFKRGSPPTPQLAIDEAKKTRDALEEAAR
jgi:uncharacterized membrane protein YqjE